MIDANPTLKKGTGLAWEYETHMRHAKERVVSREVLSETFRFEARSRMTTVITFSRLNDIGLRVLIV